MAAQSSWIEILHWELGPKVFGGYSLNEADWRKDLIRRYSSENHFSSYRRENGSFIWEGQLFLGPP